MQAVDHSRSTAHNNGRHGPPCGPGTSAAATNAVLWVGRQQHGIHTLCTRGLLHCTAQFVIVVAMSACCTRKSRPGLTVLHSWSQRCGAGRLHTEHAAVRGPRGRGNPRGPVRGPVTGPNIITPCAAAAGQLSRAAQCQAGAQTHCSSWFDTCVGRLLSAARKRSCHLPFAHSWEGLCPHCCCLPCPQVPNLRGPPSSVFSSENSTRLNSAGSSIGDQDTQQQYAAMYGGLMPAAGNLVTALASNIHPLTLPFSFVVERAKHVESATLAMLLIAHCLVSPCRHTRQQAP